MKLKEHLNMKFCKGKKIYLEAIMPGYGTAFDPRCYGNDTAENLLANPSEFLLNREVIYIQSASFLAKQQNNAFYTTFDVLVRIK